ncbi:MAG: glycerol-3-phosphate acyltransferase [Acutalibacteraceae bacterium]
MYPIFFKFKGGKGVVTVATMAALADWRVFWQS